MAWSTYPIWINGNLPMQPRSGWLNRSSNYQKAYLRVSSASAGQPIDHESGSAASSSRLIIAEVQQCPAAVSEHAARCLSHDGPRRVFPASNAAALHVANTRLSAHGSPLYIPRRQPPSCVQRSESPTVPSPTAVPWMLFRNKPVKQVDQNQSNNDEAQPAA